MFLSVVIPTYNRAHRIKASIMSILSQGLDDVEVIVVDDGSQDNTAQIVADLHHEKIKFLRTENKERGAARNAGFKLATGRYINFFDSDDIMSPCLLDLKQFVEANSNPDIVFGNISNQTTTSEKNEVKPLPYKTFTQNLLHNNFLACGSVFLKREIALLFPFNENRNLSSAEDWELWLRIMPHYRFLHFSKEVFTQVHHDERSLVTIHPERIEVRDMLFADIVLNNVALIKLVNESAVRLFIADRFTFIALAWVESNRRRARQYTIRSFKKSVWVVTRRRFWALVKKLVLR